MWQFSEGGENAAANESDEENQDPGLSILLFGTVSNLNNLGRANVWYGDGTFSVCPNLFYQLYTIHAEVHGQILPLVYSLLPSNSCGQS